MASSSCVRKSLLSLNNWSFNTNNGSSYRKERSNSNTSCKTVSTLALATSNMVDFWNRVSQQMAYIDGSTRSPSLMDGSSRGSPLLNDRTREQVLLPTPEHVIDTPRPTQSEMPSQRVQNNNKKIPSVDSCNSCGSSFNIVLDVTPPPSPAKTPAAPPVVVAAAQRGCLQRQDRVKSEDMDYSCNPPVSWRKMGQPAVKLPNPVKPPGDNSQSQSNEDYEKDQRETWHHVFADDNDQSKLKTLYKNYFNDEDYEDEAGMELELLQPPEADKRKPVVVVTAMPTSVTSTSVMMETASVGGGRSTKTRVHKYHQPFCGRDRRLSQPFDSYGIVAKRASSWEESEAVQRRRSVMLAAAAAAFPTSDYQHHFPMGTYTTTTNSTMTKCPSAGAAVATGLIVMPTSSELQLLDKRDLRYYFQHPYPRLFVTYFVIFCNFLLFAEDPISHSHTESDIPMVGNVFSFVLTKYPPEWRWSLIKVLMWFLAMLCGMVLGKLLIHGYLCGKLLRLKMFRDDQGSWMTMFLTVIVSLYVFSHAYNLLLLLWYDNCEYYINSHMGVTNASVMKAAACGTWLGDLITALMVTDMMLQDNLYPHWAPWFRQIWRRSNIPRILIFWVGSVVATSVVVTLIVSDWISWDKLNRDFVATTEISRAFLASFILVMDLLIVMQDWDFPHFTTTLHVNLPGFSVATLKWKYAEVDVTGKWFNYGIIVMVMLLDLNMWKNQIFYDPRDFGQYTGPDDKIRTLNDQDTLATGNISYWTWESRSHISPETELPYYEGDMQMNSRYMNYPLSAKWTAFIPSVIGLLLFVALVSLYGRFPSNQAHQQVNRSTTSCSRRDPLPEKDKEFGNR